MLPRRHRAVIIAAWVVSAGAAQAGSWSAEGSVNLVSDYRFRGVSLSDRKPALQGDFTLSHASGAYVSGFASTIDEYGMGDEGRGATAEIDGTIGWAFQRGGFDFDLAVAGYTYPRGHGVDYVEAPVQVSKTMGAVTGLAGFAYAPKQTALDGDNRYAWLGLDYVGDALPVRLQARLGRENGAFADQKTDWSLGASRTFGRLEGSLTYVDSDQAGGAVVLSLGARF